METQRDAQVVRHAYGRSLRHFRAVAKCSQESLALRAGINRTHVFKLESGLVNATIYTTLRICDVLGISLKRFVAEMEKFLGAAPKRSNHE